MKTLRAVAAALAACVILSACGGSPAPASANSAPSERAIPIIEPIITPPPQDDGLTDAAQQAREKFAGEWVDMGGTNLSRGGVQHVSLEMIPTDWGVSWSVNDDGTITYQGCTYSVVDDEGIQLLICNNPAPGGVAYTSSSVMIRESDFREYFDRHFVKVEVSAENIGDYIGPPVYLGAFERLDTWESGEVWVYSSNAYENGLVYIGHNSDFVFETGTGESWSPYGLILGEHSYNLGRAKGALYFVRAEYVADYALYVNAGDDPHANSYNIFRVITLTNGASYVDSLGGSNMRFDINTDDWKY